MHWLELAKNQAEERFRALPLPGAKDENFRFTPLADLKLDGHAESLAAPSASIALEAEESSLLFLQGGLVTHSGGTPGMTITDLTTAAKQEAPAVQQALRDEALFAEDKFAQLTAARWENGAFVHLPRGKKLEKALRIALHATKSEEFQRHLIVLEEGAEAVLLQESWGDETERFVGELVDVRLGKNAKLHWVIVQRHGSETQGMLRHQLRLDAGAELEITNIHLGGKKIQVREEAHLGAGASFVLEGAARGEREQHFDFWLDVQHEGRASKSRSEFSFVMADRAKAVFNGLVHIFPKAPQTEASQKCKSLLLSSKATVHAIPKLVIQTDDVKCSHGASVANVNFEQLHYLQSRGISKQEAERMIVLGFTEPVLARIPSEGMYARAAAALEQKIGGVLQ